MGTLVEMMAALRTNARMEPYLKALARIDSAGHRNLLAPFDRLLKKGLVKQGKAITFRYFSKSPSTSHSPAMRAPVHDLTGYEHALNRLHVEDFVRRVRERYHLTLLRHALALGNEVIECVAHLAPRAKVQVTIGFDVNVRKGICVFSFHLLRKGQTLWPDIEAFQEPCLLMES